jgi:hypothetical protein
MSDSDSDEEMDGPDFENEDFMRIYYYLKGIGAATNIKVLVYNQGIFSIAFKSASGGSFIIDLEPKDTLALRTFRSEDGFKESGWHNNGWFVSYVGVDS